MKLPRTGREFYDQTVTTDPAVTAWEASFDNGVTWLAGEAMSTDPEGDPLPDGALRTRWLVAGPYAELGTAVAVIRQDSTTPLLRAVDAPEILVRNGTAIYLTGAVRGRVAV